MQTLKEEQLYAKFSKCDFFMEFTTFLGHVILGDGINMAPQKTNVVKHWPQPITLFDIQRFLVLARHYR